MKYVRRELKFSRADVQAAAGKNRFERLGALLKERVLEEPPPHERSTATRLEVSSVQVFRSHRGLTAKAKVALDRQKGEPPRDQIECTFRITPSGKRGPFKAVYKGEEILGEDYQSAAKDAPPGDAPYSDGALG